MKARINQLLKHRIIRFAFVGGLATFTHVAIAFSLLRFFSASVLMANIIGFSFAFCVSYLLQSLFVFQKSLTLKNAGRFFIVQFCALLLSQLISGLLPDTNSYLRVLLVVLMIPFITYLIHQIWTYKKCPSTNI